MPRKTKLELTWIGKDERPKLEPRILVEDPALSHYAATRRDGDIFDNMLIHGDNLLALKALEADYAGKVKCVFIDPPYNTGSAFTHYDDGLEHSLWLSLMRDRLEMIRTLLSDDGSLWITIDDNEAHYLKVLLPIAGPGRRSPATFPQPGFEVLLRSSGFPPSRYKESPSLLRRAFSLREVVCKYAVIVRVPLRTRASPSASARVPGVMMEQRHLRRVWLTDAA